MKPMKLVARSLAALLLGATAAAHAGSIDNGRPLYATHCADCHGQVGIAINWSATRIRTAITRNQGGMAYLSGLTDGELSDISSYLAAPNGNDSDRLFDWAEGRFPTLLTPSAQSQTLGDYYYRHYSGSGLYVATSGGRLYLYDAGNPANGIVDLGGVTDWLGQAGL